jgi:filamentous hemagglutinin family protein
MNRSYRLVWNDATQRFVPAPEIARGRGKGSSRAAQAVLTIATLLGLGGLSTSGWAVGVGGVGATALPSGGQVAVGQATLTATAANLAVNQASQRAVINWNSFNIGSAASVDFVQPSPSAVALNRVVGNEPSQIFGQLRANGQVFLVNANGVLFAPGAQVNVHGLLASTLDTSDTDFMAGTLHFAGKAGAVRNEGHITTDAGGYVGLLGGQVSNTGTITAQLGTQSGSVALAAGSDVTLDFAGDGLLKVVVNAGAVQALVDNAGLVQADGGRVQMSAQAADALVSASVNNTGLIQARGLQSVGGVIELSGDAVYQAGVLDVSGGQGGKVAISGINVLQDGQIQAQGNLGTGGSVAIHAVEGLLQTQQAQIHADGLSQGGQIVLDGGKGAYLSGHNQAQGAQGGQIDASAQTLVLAGATLNADGLSDVGGRVRVGGDAHGAVILGLQKATSTVVNASTHLSAQGAKGQVIVWSDGDTRYEGTSVAGGVGAGFIEISAKGTLHYAGLANPGAGGQLLLDPTDIVIDVAGAATNYIDLMPNLASVINDMHGGGGAVELGNGNMVVASPNATYGGIASAGVVYLYNGQSGALISTLYGTQASDLVGKKITGLVGNNNYVVSSGSWSLNTGAVTWGSGATGVSGPVSAGNSLLGFVAGDWVGSIGSVPLSDGNYVVLSPQFGSGLGAVTWANGLTGRVGTVSAVNSMVGQAIGDVVGSGGATALKNGDYAISSPAWGSKLGAVTLVRAGSGNAVGVVTAANSLTGAALGDAVGSGGVVMLADGNYVVSSPDWLSAAVTAQGVGAVTWVDAQITGPAQGGSGQTVNASNSLTGGMAGDQVGSRGVTALTQGGFVVASPNWSDPVSGNVSAGAATWIAAGQTGAGQVVSASNSLIGAAMFDQVASGGVTALTDGNYVVNSPTFGANAEGAVTWASGTIGKAGVLLPAESLMGVGVGDQIGLGGVTALANGNYVVSSPAWGSNWGANQGLGAVTWVSGATAALGGTVTAANSMVGSQVGDQVGSGGVTALNHPNGDYVINSPQWNNAALAAVGAVTRVNGGAVQSGVVGITNSLVGAASNDQLGSGGITALSNGAYVIDSPLMGRGAVTNAGAVWLVKNSVATPYFTPEQVAAMTPAGVYVTLAATNTITVNAPVTVAGSLELNAGNTLTLNAPLTSTETSPSALVMVAGQQFINNAGANALSTPNGKWQVWSANPANDVRGGLVPNFKQYNATPGSATQPRSAALGSGNGMFYALAPTLSPTLSSTGPVVRTYDTTTSAPQAGLSLGTTGVVDGDAVVLSAAAFDYTVAGVASKQAGAGLDVTASGLSIQASNVATLVYGYQLSNGITATTTATAAGVGTIQQAVLTVSPTVVANKVYDATTSATISTLGALSGVLGSDGVGLSQSAAFQDKNAAVAKPVVVTNTLTGLDASNYIVTNTTSSADITKLVVTPGAGGGLNVIGTAVAPTKVYDATTAAQITTQGSFTGALATDQVAVASQTASYADKNVGTAKTVTVATTLTGADAGNYDVAPLTFNAAITPATLALTGTTVAPTKVYDATTAAAITAAGTLSTPLGTDQVALLSQSAAYDTKNVGTAKPVTVTSLLQGTDAGNYVIAPITAQADITRLTIVPGAPGGPGQTGGNVTGTAVAATKVYDATAAAAITTQGSFTGALAADQVSVLSQTASYDTKNIGTAKPVTVATVLQGADAGNYSVAPISLSADITPATLALSGTTVAPTKVYDATTTALITAMGTLSTPLGTDQVALLSQSAAYADKNVGTAKPVTVTTLLQGADAANYVIAPITAQADITKLVVTPGAGGGLNVTGTAVAPTKVYDATTAAQITTQGSFTGALAADQVAVASQTASYADKNVGSAKTVTVATTLTGADAGNYDVAPLTFNAAITPATLALTGTTVAATKVYDATTAAAITAAGTLSAPLGTDQVSLLSQSAAYADKNVGTAKPVTVTTVLQGLDAGNYVIAPITAQADITKLVVTPGVGGGLNVIGTAVSPTKVYDATTAAQITTQGSFTGALATDQVAVASQTASYADKNVGTAKTVTVATILTGVDAGNYDVAPITLNAAISPMTVTAVGTAVASKLFDATTTATINRPAQLSGVFSGDAVTLAQTAAFADPNVGANKVVNVQSSLSGGADVGNYVLSNPSSQVGADIIGALPPGDPLQKMSPPPLKTTTPRDADTPGFDTQDLAGAFSGNLELSVLEATLDVPMLYAQKDLQPAVLGDAGPVEIVSNDLPLMPALVEQKKELETLAEGTGVTVRSVGFNELQRIKVSIPGDMSFGSGKANITPAMAKILDQLADTIGPDQQVEVIGHTDSVGSATLNQRLSEDRAAAVRTYLIARKVAADHIRTSGRGKNEPVADNRTAPGRAKNRRVDIYVAQPGGGLQKVK